MAPPTRSARLGEWIEVVRVSEDREGRRGICRQRATARWTCRAGDPRQEPASPRVPPGWRRRPPAETASTTPSRRAARPPGAGGRARTPSRAAPCRGRRARASPTASRPSRGGARPTLLRRARPASSRSRPRGMRRTTSTVSDDEAREERSPDEARLREQVDQQAVRVDRLLAASPQLEVRDEEVVRADPQQRMVLELDQPDAPEVVAVAAEPPEVRGAAGGHRLVLEAVPRRPDVIPRLRHDGRAGEPDDGCGDDRGSVRCGSLAATGGAGCRPRRRASRRRRGRPTRRDRGRSRAAVPR